MKEIWCYARSHPKSVWTDTLVVPPIKGEIVTDEQPEIAGMIPFREINGHVHYVWPEQVRDSNDGD